MKNEKTFNLIGLILGVAMILAGILIMANGSAYLSNTTRVDSYTFGADYYTEQYAATRAVANNTGVTVSNLCWLGERFSRYAGLAFIFSGALVSLSYGKKYAFCNAVPAESVEPGKKEPSVEEGVSQIIN